MQVASIFTEVAKFPIVSNEISFPKWKTYPEFDEMDGVHAIDIIRGRDKAINHLKEHTYTAVLFSRATPPQDKSVLYEDLENLMKSHNDKGVNSYIHCFLFQYLWEQIEKAGIAAHQIFAIEFQGSIAWSTHDKYYGLSSEYAFSKTETEFRYGEKTYSDLTNEKNLFLVLV